MAEKKSKVKAHRGFIHIPKRRGPRRPPRFPGLGGPRRPIQQPVRPESMRRYNDELRLLRDFAKARGKTIPRFPTGNPPPSIRRDPRKMKEFRLKQLRNQIYQTRRFLNLGPRKTQQQLIPIKQMPTQKQINDARKFLQQDVAKQLQKTATAAMGSKRQTAAPAQQAVKNPNRRRPKTAEPLAQKARARMPNRRRTMVSKGGTVRKKK
jgi:hypothetical protein